jgi:hypothetical protein
MGCEDFCEQLWREGLMGIRDMFTRWAWPRVLVRSDEMAEDALHACRVAAKEGLGFNCTFVDDDVKVLVGLAQRAVLAGLASDFSDDMQQRMKAAAEPNRKDHEAALKRPIV